MSAVDIEIMSWVVPVGAHSANAFMNLTIAPGCRERNAYLDVMATIEAIPAFLGIPTHKNSCLCVLQEFRRPWEWRLGTKPADRMAI